MGNVVDSLQERTSARELETKIKAICSCPVERTLVIEKNRTPLTERTRKAAQDFLFSLSYYRKQPRSLIGRINLGLYLATFEVCPTFCCPPCPGSIIHKMAFHPPPKPTYNLIPFGRLLMDETADYRLELKPAASVFNRFLYRRCQAYTAQFRCFYLGGRTALNRLACCYVRSIWPAKTGRQLTILYSHSNGMDLGYCAGYLAFLSRRLRANVLCWDYPGYGRSGGFCSEQRLYEGIERVYEFLIKDLKVPWEQVVAVGTSLGTAATLHLVATAGQPVKGVILQGGFMSAMRVICPNRQRTSSLDQFVNIDKIVNVHVPTLVVHGCKDGLFSIVHARALHKRCPGAANIQPLFIEEGQHVDFEDYLAYWHRLHKFLHVELTSPDRSTEPCCIYHPIELKLREGQAQKATGTHSLSAPTKASTKDLGAHRTRRLGNAVVVCEHCLSIDRFSRSTFVLDLNKSIRSVKQSDASLKLMDGSNKSSSSLKKPTSSKEVKPSSNKSASSKKKPTSSKDVKSSKGAKSSKKSGSHAKPTSPTKSKSGSGSP